MRLDGDAEVVVDLPSEELCVESLVGIAASGAGTEGLDTRRDSLRRMAWEMEKEALAQETTGARRRAARRLVGSIWMQPVR